MQAEHGHIQEVILQNFVPHERYYGREPAQIADAPRGATGRRGSATSPTFRCRSGRGESRSRTWSGSSARPARLLPGVGIQVPPNLADWWPQLVEAGATDLGGLSANGDHISPEHPFPSPHQVRQRLEADGVALTERLCVYAQYIDPEWVAPAVLDTIREQYWSFIPRRVSGTRTPAPRPIRADLVAGAIERGARRRGAARRTS